MADISVPIAPGAPPAGTPAMSGCPGAVAPPPNMPPSIPINPPAAPPSPAGAVAPPPNMPPNMPINPPAAPLLPAGAVAPPPNMPPSIPINPPAVSPLPAAGTAVVSGFGTPAATFVSGLAVPPLPPIMAKTSASSLTNLFLTLFCTASVLPPNLVPRSLYTDLTRSSLLMPSL